MQAENVNSSFRTVVLTSAEGKKQLLHIHQDSDSKMEALFDPSEMCQSVPYKDRNLPSSFFKPPNQAHRPHHFHSRSTGLLDLSLPNNSVLIESNSELHHKHALSNSNSNNNNATHLMPPKIENRFHSQIEHSGISRHGMHFDSSPSRRHRFAKAERKRAFHSQIIHGRSKSFPQLLDMKQMASSGYLAGREIHTNSMQNDFHEKRFSIHNEPIPIKSFKLENEGCTRRWNEAHQEPVYQSHVRSASSIEQFDSSFELQSAHPVTPQRESYSINASASWSGSHDQSNQLGSNFEPCQSSIQQQINPPMMDSPQGSSFLMRLMREKNSLQDQISKQGHPAANPSFAPSANPRTFHRRDASYDSGLSLGGLSLTPDEHPSTFVSPSSNEMTFHSTDPILAASVNLPNNLGHVSNSQLEDLLDSLPASDVDVISGCPANVTYNHTLSEEPSQNLLRSDDVMQAQREPLYDVVPRNLQSNDLEPQHHPLWL